MKIIITLLAILTLSACSRPEIIGSRTDVYKIVGKTRPKHFYVDIQRVSDGAIYNHVYISKHCNDHEEYARIGKTITATMYHYQRKNYYTSGKDTLVDWWEFNHYPMHDCLCYDKCE